MIHALGDAQLDDESRQLRRGGAEVSLTPLAFRLAELLVKLRPRAVSKDDLMDALWPDRLVSEANLSLLVSELRRAIGDSARAPRILRTVRGYGYALVATADANGARARPRATLLWGSVEIALPEGEVVAGRDPDLPVRVAHPSVSRHHARLVVEATGMTIQDLASRNGTFVNEVRVERVTPLAPGDFVRLGSCVLRVVDTSAETRSTDSNPA